MPTLTALRSTSSVPAGVRRAAAEATLTLPFRIPDQQWFTLKQAGAVFGLSESTAEKLYDKGAFTGHSHNAGAGQRDHKRVLRASVVAYGLRTANYADADLLAALIDAQVGCLRYLPRESLLRIAAEAQRLAHDKPLSR